MHTTFLIKNMHCPSCVATLTALFTSPPLNIRETSISISLLTGLVDFESDDTKFPTESVIRAIEDAGFEVAGDGLEENIAHARLPSTSSSNRPWFETRRGRERRLQLERDAHERRASAHLASCKACQEWDLGNGKGKGKEECIVSIADQEQVEYRTELLVEGMTCASCIGTVERIFSTKTDDRISDSQVTLVPGRAVVRHIDAIKPEELVEMLDDAGYDGKVIKSERVPTKQQQETTWLKTELVLDGMTCASCVGAIKSILQQLPGIQSFDVTLIPEVATVVHDPSVIQPDKLAEEIEDGGYGAKVVSSVPAGIDPSTTQDVNIRKVKLRIDGMFCDKCSGALNDLLASLKREGKIRSYTSLSMSTQVTSVEYNPQPPEGFTLRTLKSLIASQGPFSLHVVRSTDSLTLLARQAQARESRAIGLRFLVTLVFAIPTFLIAIVFMSLLPSSHHLARYFATPIWGSATRGTIALFVLATPVQLGVGSIFYMRAWKSFRGVWTRKSWRDRLFRWGSMDTLVALGTTAAWAASVAYMALDVVTPPTDGMGGDMGYFDSSVFLMLFILAGRWLEGIGRRKTGEAVEQLGDLKPQTGILWTEETVTDLKRMSLSSSSSESEPTPQMIQSSATGSVEVDFLERGDLIIIPSGSAVPLDSVLIASSAASNFDESSLTGEAKPVHKKPNDTVYVGSTNLGPSAVVAKVLSGPGETMMDGIVSAVRDAMARKASLERLADLITGYFVPAIVGVACLTFGIWIVRGYSGDLPPDWLTGQDGRRGGWVLFSVQFAIAVLVVACPCGIGLAAPTAQMIGMGLAAQLGIVPYGGSEAFQHAIELDCVVFDKTGTITTGSFEVSHSQLFDLPFPGSRLASRDSLLRLVEVIEHSSNHPISSGIRSFCHTSLSTDRLPTMKCLRSEEIPGRGLSAQAEVENERFDVLIGNRQLLRDHETRFEDLSVEETVNDWSDKGASIVFVAVRQQLAEPVGEEGTSPFHLVAVFGVEDPPRPEAIYVIQQLEKVGVKSFMCTGDNERTALAVAKQVGIGRDHIAAGLLPNDKRDFIENLQSQGSQNRLLVSSSKRRSVWFGKRRTRTRARAKVLFVGDGINDIVALTQADVGVSMGTGAAVALSSSDFCLLSSNLLSLLTLLSLARSTFNKILSNFVWACCFNVVLIPIAAGAFFDLGKTRLPPVWASLAMALSSISVVTNSLLLRWTFRPPASVRSYYKDK